jgi:hypothetical protein
MRKFFLVWHDRVPQISQKASGKSAALEISQKASGKLAASEVSRKASGKLAASEVSRKASGKLAISANGPGTIPFTLSWSHYVVLLSIKDPDERGFYEIEASLAGECTQTHTETHKRPRPIRARQEAGCASHKLAGV